MREDALSIGVFCDQPSLIRRLVNEFMEAAREFRSDPKQYLTDIIRSDGSNHRRKTLFRFGLAMGIVVYAMMFAAILIFWTVKGRPPAAGEKNIEWVILPPLQRPNIPLPQSNRIAGGGGGGGNNSPLPASVGEKPLFLSVNPINAPTTRPQLKPPLLQTHEWLLGDPSHNLLRDELLPTGMPDGVIAPPSDGPGSGRGIGTGKEGGVGRGEGPGFGPGKDGGQGTGSYGPGGRPENHNAVDLVDTKPIPLNRPRPNYTEEARREKAQGMVQARVLVGADGAIKLVRITRGLPHGLNEEAIRAALQMRFRPATKNGLPVAHWIKLEIEFNLR